MEGVCLVSSQDLSLSRFISCPFPEASCELLYPMGDMNRPTGVAERLLSLGPELLSGISCRWSFPVLAAALE